MNPHNRSHLGVLVAFIGATVLITWPLALKLTQGVPYGGDAFQFIWNGWWVAKVTHDPSLSLWWTPYQYAPYGASLALHDLSPLNAYPQSWLRTIVGDFGAYNLLILFHYVLGAWGAYILAWYLTGNRLASVVAGVIYGFSTHHAMHLSQLSTVSSGWMPLAVYYLIKYTRDGGWRDGVLAILMLLTAALSHWYSLVFTGVIFFGLMLIGQAGLKDHFAGFKRWQRAFIPCLAAVLILSPLLFMAWVEMGGVPIDWLVALGRQYVLDPIWLIIPPPSHPVTSLANLGGLFSERIPGNLTEGVASIGLAATFLGIAAWFRRNPTTRAWCWLALALFLISLGPTVILLGKNLGIPGPFLIWERIPGLNLVRVPARFVGPFTLALAISAAGWLAGVPQLQKKSRLRTVVLWVLPLIILFETTVVPLPMSGDELHHPALERLPEIYSDATGDPNPPDLIIYYPLVPLRAQFSYQQTIHELPTVNGHLSNPPEGAIDYFFTFNWHPEYLRTLGADLLVYQPWASLDQTIPIPEDAKDVPPEWAGRRVDALVLFRDVMGCTIAYEDDDLIIFVL